MSRRSSKKVCVAPMAVASDGAVLVNAYQLATEDNLDAAIEVARRSGLVVFVGVVVPRRLHGRLLRDLDDAAADVVGRVGGSLGRRPKR